MIQDSAPILHSFVVWDMKWSRQQRLSSTAVASLKRLVTLAKAAYVPASLEEYHGCSKRAGREVASVSGKCCKRTQARSIAAGAYSKLTLSMQVMQLID